MPYSLGPLWRRKQADPLQAAYLSVYVGAFFAV